VIEGRAAELERYYALRGWDVGAGLPVASTLKRLGMDDVAWLVAAT
jgi:aldehyde:ferredoxin oxidoreductase